MTALTGLVLPTLGTIVAWKFDTIYPFYAAVCLTGLMGLKVSRVETWAIWPRIKNAVGMKALEGQKTLPGDEE